MGNATQFDSQDFVLDILYAAQIETVVSARLPRAKRLILDRSRHYSIVAAVQANSKRAATFPADDTLPVMK